MGDATRMVVSKKGSSNSLDIPLTVSASFRRSSFRFRPNWKCEAVGYSSKSSTIAHPFGALCLLTSYRTSLFLKLAAFSVVPRTACLTDCGS